MTQAQGAAKETPELEWIQMKKDFDLERANEESAKDKFIRKFKQNPLVPIGNFFKQESLANYRLFKKI